jgi:hypothetical protein
MTAATIELVLDHSFKQEVMFAVALGVRLVLGHASNYPLMLFPGDYRILDNDVGKRYPFQFP